MGEKDLKKMTYAELEEEANKVLSKLGEESLPLDEASKLYGYGKNIASEMENRLTELEKSVTDTISNE